jgi:RHS repeat-associated protein
MPVCEQDFEDGVLKQTRIHLLGARGIEGIITLPSNGAPTLNWLFYDGHGNLVRTMNTSFALSGFQWRGVWGERTTSTPGRGYCANLGHPEDETGLVYMRARYYEPTTGRFISEDPARDGMNWYLFADGDPVGKVDFTGKMPALIVAMLMGAAMGIGTYIGWSLATDQPITWQGILTAGLVGAVAGALFYLQVAFVRGLLYFGREWVEVTSAILNPSMSGGLAAFCTGASFTSGLGAGYGVGKGLHSLGMADTGRTILYAHEFRVAMWMGILEVE